MALRFSCLLPVVLFREGRAGLSSREGAWLKPANPPFVVVLEDLGCRSHVWFPLPF